MMIFRKLVKTAGGRKYAQIMANFSFMAARGLDTLIPFMCSRSRPLRLAPRVSNGAVLCITLGTQSRPTSEAASCSLLMCPWLSSWPGELTDSYGSRHRLTMVKFQKCTLLTTAIRQNFLNFHVNLLPFPVILTQMQVKFKNSAKLQSVSRVNRGSLGIVGFSG